MAACSEGRVTYTGLIRWQKTRQNYSLAPGLIFV